MQSNELKGLETRTLKEICSTLKSDQRYAMAREMIADLRVRERTVENWMRGQVPGSWSQQRDVAKIVKGYFGFTTNVSVLAESLFKY